MKYKNGPKNNLAMYFVQVSISVTSLMVQIYSNSQNTHYKSNFNIFICLLTIQPAGQMDGQHDNKNQPAA